MSPRTNQHLITRDLRIREYQRKMIGAGRIEVTFQIPITGTAKTGAAVSATDYLHFGVGFYPQRGERDMIDPAFRAGFSLRPAGVNFDPAIPLGYLGFANCPFFDYNDDGLCVGAICHIGVVNLDAVNSNIPFKGFCHLSFLGMASRAPLDSGNHHQYTGPNSVKVMERQATDDD